MTLNLKSLKLSLALLAMSCLSPAFMSAPAWAQSDPLATPISAEDALEGDKEGDVTEKAMEDDDGVENSSVESQDCLLYTSPSPRDLSTSRMPSSA